MSEKSEKQENSLIYLQRYAISRGFVTRYMEDESLLICCVESPEQVFKTLLPDYNITSYNDCPFFDTSDTRESSPLIGLGISIYTPQDIKGIKSEITGKLKNLINSDEIYLAKRQNQLHPSDIEDIISNLLEIPKSLINALSPEQYQRTLQERQETIKLLRKFL
jgi:hypothetical protein